jgi:hypothetical protein
VFEPLVIVSMVPWVGKFSGYCGGSCTGGRGESGGVLVSVFTRLALVLLGVAYVISVGVVVDEGFGYVVVMAVVDVVVGGFGYAVELCALVPLFLLTENIESVLHFCEPHSLPVNVLPMSIGSLEHSLPSQDRLLFMPKPFNFLFDSC